MPDPVDECRDSAAPCKWNHQRSEKWISAVNEAAWEKLTDHEWLKTVGCPRCGHDMFVPYEDSVVIARTVEAFERLYGDAPDFADRIADIAEGHMLQPGSDATGRTAARCNCGEEHEGQPDEVDAGCGQWGSIDAPGSK